MSVVLVPTPPRINLVDDRGKITRPWSMYFDDVFTRLGGSVAPSIDEIADELDGIDQAPTPQPFAPGNGDLLPPVVMLPAATNDNGRLEALEAEVAVLRQMITGLQQGLQA